MAAPKLSDLESAAAIVHRQLGPTPQYTWPLLCKRAGCEVWVKHENHTPIGAFKVRGGVHYLHNLVTRGGTVRGIISATRGNHGQSLAYAAARAGIPATIVAPVGNNPEKNAAMRAFGAELIEHGADFHAAVARAREIAEERGLHLVVAYHPWLRLGVASYALELFRAVPDLHTVYVPVGQGSGICGVIAVRDALRVPTQVVGVVAEKAPAYKLSFEAGKAISTESADTLADGVACRAPDEQALTEILKGAERIVAISEAATLAAMRHYFTDTHNVAEGAGAIPLAALLAERGRMSGRKVALILSGGNADSRLFARALTSGTMP
jgi:threonine dehydratase